MMKSVVNTHPNTQMINAITIIDNKNDKHPFISFVNFVFVLIQELLPTYQNYPVLQLYLVQMSSCCRALHLLVPLSHCGEHKTDLLTAILRKLLL